MPDRAIKTVKRTALLALSFVVVLVIRLMLTFASHRLVLRFMPRGRTQLGHPALVMRVANAVSSVARLVPDASCLTQALSVQFILACRGYASELNIGVKRGSDNAVEAHAWLVNGEWIAIGGTPDEIAEYVPLTKLPVR
jgi:hypothetical protein